MAIVVLVLWAVTAGAGFYLLATSSLGRGRIAVPEAAVPEAAVPEAAVPEAAVPEAAGPRAAAPDPRLASAAAGPPGQGLTPGTAADLGTRPPRASSPERASAREVRRAARQRFDPPSLTAARKAPVLPEVRSLLEFAHPACAIIGLACWLGFTLIHNRALGWSAFGLIAVTACLGLTWFTANVAAARRGSRDRPAPHFARRLVVLHGCAAAVTVTLAALTALVTRG